MERKCKKQWRRWIRLFILPLLFFICCNTSAFAQGEIKITGKVIDASNMEVIGANVMVKGTTIGVITDLNGEYSITVPNEKSVLVFSFVGYRSQEQTIGKRRKINVTLEDDSKALDEVVVIAYGTQSKATLTGALSSINSKELIKSPVASITNVLAGALPGVSTVQTSGQPGSDAASIYVRGVGSLSSASSSPLILVDGVERDFSQIDPNEIENLSILKDASSTAVFGVRGANGVVLVTTKRGKNSKPTINVSSLTGVQQPLSFVRQTGSYEFARFWNMKQQNDGAAQSTYFTREAIEAYRIGGDPLHPSMDWADYMYNKFFLQTKNNINISGGTDAVKYFVSIGYLYQNGILKQFKELPYNNNYKYNRYNYRANLDFQLTRTTTMKLNIGGNVGQQQEPNTGDVDNPFIYTQIWALPFAGLGIVNGTRTIVPPSYTPVGGANVDGLRTYWGTGYKQKYVTTLNMDVDITQKLDMLTKGLSVSIKGSYDNQFQLSKNRTGGNVETQLVHYKSTLENSNLPQTDPDFDKTIVYIPSGNNSTPLNYGETHKRDRNWYIEGRLNYQRTFGDHKVSTLFLYNHVIITLYMQTVQ